MTIFDDKPRSGTFYVNVYPARRGISTYGIPTRRPIPARFAWGRGPAYRLKITFKDQDTA